MGQHINMYARVARKLYIPPRIIYLKMSTQNGKVEWFTPEGTLKPVRRIVVRRVEGNPITDDLTQHVFTTLRTADRFLFLQSRTAPERGYDKTDVVVMFQDGDVVTLRIDLQKNRDVSIETHMKMLYDYLMRVAQNG